MNYYNDNDEFACEWLRELIKDRLIPEGEVDDRDIRTIEPRELEGFTQCHFFAGVGGWPLALRLSGWPEDREVWTGSCPCQPFSIAGKGGGVEDERHLWPAFRWLIAQEQPSVVFGEQVASKAGRAWFSGVRLDLEAMGYGVGGADLCAASVGSPQIRQRLWWVGDSKSEQDNGREAGIVAEAEGQGGCSNNAFDVTGADGGLANSVNKGLEGHPWDEYNGSESGREQENEAGSTSTSCWSRSTWHECRDGKQRRIPTQPSLFPLAPRLPNRMGLLRGAGNSISPEVAEVFISAFMDTRK